MKTFVLCLTVFTLLHVHHSGSVVLHRLREPATKSSSSSSSFSSSSSSSFSSSASASSARFLSEAARRKRRERWANAAFELLRGRNCSRQPFITSPAECEKLLRLPKSEFNIYVAEPMPHGKYRAFLPDRAIDKGRTHAGVLVLDPYPTASFGHLVLVYFIDQTVGKAHCERNHGYITGKGQILQRERERERCVHVCVYERERV
uniref:Uncharacterized protein n=1 Tax=Octopus bimaculoides TaxID=37653 RepID=A0A0L8GMK6_OCTBM